MYQSTLIPKPSTTSEPSAQEPSTSSVLSPSTSLHYYKSTTLVPAPYLQSQVSTKSVLRPTSSAVSVTYPWSTQFDKGRVFKVIVIGNAGVGKTTLTYRFCEGKFLESAEATIGVDFRSRVVNIDGEDITLQLWDTAGQERFRQSMVRHYYKNAHAVVFVYDVTNADSFDGLKRWIQESHEHGLGYFSLPKILIGNKCDGVSVVTTNVAQRFADQYDMPLFETSARLDSQCDNIESIFMTLAFKLKNNKTFNRPLSGNNQPGESERVVMFTDQDKSKDKYKWGCC